ncbi:N-acetyl-gamma-glutamyl-phosphate reductase [Helicobacter sp. 11S02629-2]|uniref:N-acetyl-gamma-glutamyl-phosphate reductase n=1 Tax=Helicobacter sp. 11S02629-2 TaxID=1476195 RepID=UPI000BA5EE5C|nr:N-acetyl-gamma-glutamyl-phosphate reductase [Helicobacter sp. 11S02629-2]PAF45845.1 N-acetyl-gamma-glutamyl-phosphate reductase [Helicobacter sp. 11S02629-2]
MIEKSTKIKASIVGSTGYVGLELVRLLSTHPNVELVRLISQSYDKKPLGDVYGSFFHTDYICSSEDLEELSHLSDVIFLALPHGISSAKVNAEILSRCKIIDMGADFRLSDVKVYEEWYCEHHAKDLLKEAVYGLCELNRANIKSARLLANPGCYTTSSILPLYPLLKDGLIESSGIIIDSKSGFSGAGRSANADSVFSEVNENFKAYKLASHRHTPEIEEHLSMAHGTALKVLFTPHLVPMQRGILSVMYAKPLSGVSLDSIKETYDIYYGLERFIRLLDTPPETRWVKGTNYCDIYVTLDSRTNTLVIVSAIDNLMKGAASQALQNLNIMFGFEESTGLPLIAQLP